MNMLSFLNAIDFPLLEEGFQIGLDWLGQIIKFIIEGVGIIGVGIILFTLILKAITLPFDIYQRVKMRKQTLIMKKMQPELDKLQKQYANDKSMYSQKMMELYKKNGYSMLGACLPAIISIIILMVAFWAFNSYSQYANLAMYERMMSAYNVAVKEYSVDGLDYQLKRDEENNIVLEGGKYVFVCGEQTHSAEWAENAFWEQENVTYTMSEIGDVKYLTVTGSADQYIFYIYSLETTQVKREYKIDSDKLYATNKAEIDAIVAADETAGKSDSDKFNDACYSFVSDIGAEAAAKSYRDNPPSFLWVKNVWYADVSYAHPIQTYDDFIGNRGIGNQTVTLSNGTESTVGSIVTRGMYENITEKLNDEKVQPNGYFILIILSIGLMVLSQFLSMRSQKESNKYQTADGSGAKTQKMMLIMMPLIYAIFAFMYSAAFSIYMAMSSIVGILVTLGCNFFIGMAFKKKEEEEIKERYTRTVPWKNKTDGDSKGKKKK